MVRLFGRGKDESAAEPTCASCGRTLLPGEWAQTVVREDGHEVILCSLCAQYEQPPAEAPLPEAPKYAEQPIAVTGRPAPSARTRSPQHEQSDAFWKALKDKDVEIERLQAEMSRVLAENQSLSAQLAMVQRQLTEAAAPAPESAYTPGQGPFAEAAPVAQETGPAHDTPTEAFDVLAYEAASEEEDSPLSDTAGLPRVEPLPAEAAGLQAEQVSPAEVAGQAQAEAADAMHEGEDDATAQIPAAVAPVIVPAPQPVPQQPPQEAIAQESGLSLQDSYIEPAPVIEPAPAGITFAVDDESTGAFTEPPTTMFAEEARSEGFDFGPPAEIIEEPEDAPNAVELSLLQRGVDLFNVSSMPRRVAETSELLGLPQVNIRSDDDSVVATLIWSMAWYEYVITLNDGEVELRDRGYDDRSDLPSLGTVRADGTIQLAPLAVRRPQPRPSQPQAPRPVPAPQPDDDEIDSEATDQIPASPAGQPPAQGRVVSPGNADVIAKSLKGNRTDDEAVSWDEMAARDFDWGR